MLALRRGASVAVDRLAELTGGSPGAVRTTVSRLRAGSGSATLVGGDGLYRLRAETDAAHELRLDVEEERADALIARGRADEAVALLGALLGRTRCVSTVERCSPELHRLEQQIAQGHELTRRAADALV